MTTLEDCRSAVLEEKMTKHRNAKAHKHVKSKNRKGKSHATTSEATRQNWQQEPGGKGKFPGDTGSHFQSRPKSVEKTYWRQ